MRQRYNLAFVPVDEALQLILQRYAHVLYSDDYDDYILGPEALAHVTLCQFYADSDADACDAYDDFGPVDDLGITITQGHIRPGTLVNQGFFIAEFEVAKDPALMTLQKRCFDCLQDRGLDPRTPWDRYAPHFTLARVRSADLPAPDPSIIGEFAPIRLTAFLGRSSENGMLRPGLLKKVQTGTRG